MGRLSVAPGRPLIWKEGAVRKIDEEIREMEEWNRLVPGLVPDVKDRFARLDLFLLGETGPGVAELLDRTRARYASTIKAVGMKAD